MSTATITAKVQILPSEPDHLLLEQTMTIYRDACNYVAAYIFKTHDLKLMSVHKALYVTVRHRFGLGAQMTQSVFRTVIARYKTILSNQHEWVQPNFKKPQLDLVWNRDYSLSKERFSVGTLAGRVKLPYLTKGMEKYFTQPGYKFGTAKLICKHGKYFLCIGMTFEVPDCEISDIEHVVGIDRGINFVMTTYDDNSKTGFINGRPIKQKRAHYKKLRQELQKRQTPSARRRLKAIGQRENRWMGDLNHQFAKALVENNPEHTLFVLEDLTGIRSATERVRTRDRYVSVSWAFYDLECKIIYKAKLKGSLVLKVDPRHTSQRCPICGHVQRSNRNKKLHRFVCKKCGYRSNDDRVAAMNLHRMGRDFLNGVEVPGAVIAE